MTGWGPNWGCGKTEDYGSSSMKKVKTHFMAKKTVRLKISTNFPHGEE